ncbi:O-antigen ligase family protein [Nocardioides dilutus]
MTTATMRQRPRQAPAASTSAAGPAWRPQAPLLTLSLVGMGALMTVAGLGLRGSSWILPDGLLGGGVALILVAPFARGALDVIVTLSPFMFYTLSPVGGILTVGSSDLLLPVVVGVIVVAAVVGSRVPDRLPRLSFAAPMLVVSAVLVTASTCIWTIVDPDFLAKRSIADAVKLGIGVAYFIVVYVLARQGGQATAMRAFRLWSWTATALSVGSLAGVTGAVQIIPSDGYRSNGYFEDPNLYAGYLLVSLSIVLFLGTMGDLAWLPFQGLAIVGGVLMTGSRGGLASLVLLLVLALLIINSARIRGMILGLVAVATGFIMWLVTMGAQGPSILGINRLVGASDDVGDDPRLRLWGVAVDKWLDNPLTGIGLGQFERFSIAAGGALKTTGLGYVTHNTFLFFLVALGVLGLGLFLALLGWLVARLYSSRLPRQAKHALLSGVLVLCSQFMTLNLQNLRYVWIYFGLVLAMSVVTGPSDADPPDALAQEPVKGRA